MELPKACCCTIVIACRKQLLHSASTGMMLEDGIIKAARPGGERLAEESPFLMGSSSRSRASPCEAPSCRRAEVVPGGSPVADVRRPKLLPCTRVPNMRASPDVVLGPPRPAPSMRSRCCFLLAASRAAAEDADEDPPPGGAGAEGNASLTRLGS